MDLILDMANDNLPLQLHCGQPACHVLVKRHLISRHLRLEFPHITSQRRGRP